MVFGKSHQFGKHTMGKEGRQQKLTKNTLPTTPKRQFDLRKKYKHDQFCKDNLRDLDKARKFLRLMLKPEIVDLLDLDRLELSSESFLDEELKKLYADVLYRIPVKNGDETIVVFVLIELKTESDKWTVFQQTKYIVRIWDEEYRKASKEKRLDQFLLPMVVPVIFHHGEKRFTASTELIDQVRTLTGLKPYTLNVKSLLFDVVTLGEKDFPEDLEICVLLMILQAVFSKNVAERLMVIYQKLRPKRHEARYQRLWQDCLFYATSSARNFTKQECEAIITEIRNTGDTIMSTTTAADQFIKEGFVKGEIHGESNAIIVVLKARFSKLPKSTDDAIRAITDLKVLNKLTALAATCQSLDEFTKALN